MTKHIISFNRLVMMAFAFVMSFLPTTAHAGPIDRLKAWGQEKWEGGKETVEAGQKVVEFGQHVDLYWESAGAIDLIGRTTDGKIMTICIWVGLALIFYGAWYYTRRGEVGFESIISGSAIAYLVAVGFRFAWELFYTSYFFPEECATWLTVAYILPLVGLLAITPVILQNLKEGHLAWAKLGFLPFIAAVIPPGTADADPGEANQAAETAENAPTQAPAPVTQEQPAPATADPALTPSQGVQQATSAAVHTGPSCPQCGRPARRFCGSCGFQLQAPPAPAQAAASREDEGAQVIDLADYV